MSSRLNLYGEKSEKNRRPKFCDSLGNQSTLTLFDNISTYIDIDNISTYIDIDNISTYIDIDIDIENDVRRIPIFACMCVCVFIYLFVTLLQVTPMKLQ